MSSQDSLRTRFTERFGIRYPIAQAGMGSGLANPELAAAVSNAGGLGIFGATNQPLDAVLAGVRTIKASTDQPFGVNFVIALPEGEVRDPARLIEVTNAFRDELGLPEIADIPQPPHVDLAESIEQVLREGIPLISFGLGDPSPYIPQAHELGTAVMSMVSTVEDAVIAAGAGADVIVAQGFDAGGHRSNFHYQGMDRLDSLGTFSLTPQVVDAVETLVLAAGGVMDGRGLAAALALGADGVLMGTRFLMARESAIFPAYRRALIGASGADTVLTDGPTGRPARSVRNRLTEEVGGASLPFPLQALTSGDVYLAAWKSDRAEFFPLWAGQGVGMAREVKPAAEIVEEVVSEALRVAQQR